MRHALDFKSIPREDLTSFLAGNINHLVEDEALAILENPYVTPRILGMMAQSPRIASFYSVRLRLVAHRQTPQAHAVKFVHYLYWPDLLRLSVDVTVPAPVRRAVDTQLLNRVGKLTLGEKISSARRCSHALIKVLLTDPDPRVFAALLINQRLREEDLVDLINSGGASPEHVMLLAADSKWSFRYAIRKALVLSATTPRAIAASQLRHLSRRDLLQIHGNPSTSTYLRRCIERMTG